MAGSGASYRARSGAGPVMSIRTRLLVACLCCAFVPLIGYAGFTYARTVRHLSELQEAQLAAREIAVGQALDDRLTEELGDLAATASWDEFVAATRRRDLRWARRQMAAMPTVTSGGAAQLYTLDGEPLLTAGPPSAPSLWRSAAVVSTLTGGAPAAGYEMLDGRLSIVVAQLVRGPAAGSEPLAVLASARAVDHAMLATIGSYAGAVVTVPPLTVVEELAGVEASSAAGSGVLGEVGERVHEGDYLGAYLAVHDADGFRSGLVAVSIDRGPVALAIAEIRTTTAVALAAAFVVAVLVALLLSRRVSRPLHELAAAATGIAAGETLQHIEVRGEDEVGQLARAFNTMSERVTERVTDLSEKIRGVTDELIDLNVVFGETLTDTVDVEAELGHMIPRVGAMMKADLTCLYLAEEERVLWLSTASGDLGPYPLALEAAARRAVETAAPVVTREGEDWAAGEAIPAEAGPSAASGSGGPERSAAGPDPSVAAGPTAPPGPADRRAGSPGAVRLVTDPPAPGSPGAASLAAAPLSRLGRVTGALVVLVRGRHFDAQDTAFLSALAGQVAVAAQNADMYRRLEESYFSTVGALACAIEAKDDYTADHCRLIAGMAETVGRRMGLPEPDLRLLRYAAILHDVGKTGVPESILRHPGRLDDAQFAAVAEHTVIGESIVARIPYLRPLGPVIRAAHERWDGHGYPDRLRGDAVPLPSRIVFVCDAYHAMTSDRPYRKALTHEAALTELCDNAGSQFDPAVVEAFVASHDAIERLFAGGERGAGRVDRVLATVLFTDIVDSTVKAAALGDGAWHEVLERHHAIVRAVLRRHRGVDVETAGDGFLATFDGPARAVECAVAIGREVAPLGLEIRAGCHTGEVEVSGADVGGIAVHIGARVAALAGPGEVLVSGTVKDLVAGSGLAFDDRGEHELKGVPGTWRLYAVRP